MRLAAAGQLKTCPIAHAGTQHRSFKIRNWKRDLTLLGEQLASGILYLLTSSASKIVGCSEYQRSPREHYPLKDQSTTVVWVESMLCRQPTIVSEDLITRSYAPCSSCMHSSGLGFKNLRASPRF